MAKRTRKRKMETEEKAVFEWEKDTIFTETLKEEMETSYELPQIYFFLQLTKEVLNITHLSMYEVERMLLMPQASKQLSHIMTCLLGNPSSIKSKQNIPPMPYHFWTNILLHKLNNWFKFYQSKHQNPLKTFDVLGIEPEFWKVFPDANAIEGKDFQDFTFKQRIWLLKTVCDTVIHSRKSIQDEISKQPAESQVETVLGIDRHGARYIYFPQFLHNDLRVYRHCIDNKILSSVKPKQEVEEEKPNVDVVLEQTPKPTAPRAKRKKRRSRWSKGSLPPKVSKKTVKIKSQNGETLDQSTTESNSNSLDTEYMSRCSSKMSEISERDKSMDFEITTSNDVLDDKCEDMSDIKDSSDLGFESRAESDISLNNNLKNTEESKVLDNLDDSFKESIKKSLNKSSNLKDSFIKDNNVSTIDDVSKSSKTDDEKLKKINASNILEQAEPNIDLLSDVLKNVNNYKLNDDKLSKNDICDDQMEIVNKCANDELSLDLWMKVKMKDKERKDSSPNSSLSRRSARIKHISEIKSEIKDAENIADMCETEELSSMELRDSLCRVSSPEEDFINEEYDEKKWKVDSFNELIDDLSVSSFQLVADSVDSLKDLIDYISSDKIIPDYNCKKNYETLKSEASLVKRMKKLVRSLEDVDNILKESTRRARKKLQKEWINFANGVTAEDQDQQDGIENPSNCWLIGPQGCSLEHFLNSEQCSETLSHTALPHDNAKEPELKITQANITSTATSFRQNDQASEIKDETESETKDTDEVGEEKCLANEGNKKDKKNQKAQEADRKTEDSNKAEKDKTEDGESRPTRRVLRARGVPSYTEQFFSDDESDEEEADHWADIEAVYAPAITTATTCEPSTFDQHRQTADSYDDEYEEDSDQDWILPGTRKRKSKRPSASRRLKSFQTKIQNIQENKAIENDHQHDPLAQASQTSSTKTMIFRQIINFKRNQQIAKVHNIASTSISTTVRPTKVMEIESQDPNLHSVLDIKDEGPIYDTTASSQQNITNPIQSNYVVVTAGQAPVANYYVMQQNPTTVVSQNQFIQPTAFVPQMVQNVSTQGYYVQSANPTSNYIVQNPSGIITTAPRSATLLASTTPVVYQQQPGPPQLISSQPQIVQTPSNYVQYVSAPMQQRQAQPRIINTMTLTPPKQIVNRVRMPGPITKMPGPLSVGSRPNFPHPPNGAVIRSAPIASNILKPGQRTGLPRNPGLNRQVLRMSPPKKLTPVKANTNQGQKSESLIVLSDSDDEIEMIIPGGSTPKAKPTPIAPKPGPTTSTSSTELKNVIPPELLERMNEGNISLSPIKPAQPPPQQSNSTQLVVVVNETGSHYALALPNGSKLILTPEQVAQIRASNGGKLVL